MQKPTITIIGAGLSGAYLALLLAKRNYKVRIFERYSKKELLVQTPRRSVNLTFYAYGMKAFEEAGLWESILPYVTKLSGSVTFVASKNNKPIVSKLDESMPYYTISRTKLLSLLLQMAGKNPYIKIFYNTPLLSVDSRSRTITVQKSKSSLKIMTCDVVVGADGVNSIVRSHLQRGQNACHSQSYSSWKYKQITLGSKSVQKLSLQPTMMYAWTRRDCSVAAFPNGDGSFTAMLTLECQKDDMFKKLTSPVRIKRFLRAYFPDLYPAYADITSSLVTNPEGAFVTMSTTPWHDKDFLVLVGDAAHAFLPFYGQGFSAAFADCQELVSLLDMYDPKWEKIFPVYQRNRKQHTDVLAALSQESFLQHRRERKADYYAIYNRVESILHQVFPPLFPSPLFTLIAHEPTKAAHFFRMQKQKRKIAVFLGVPIVTAMATFAIALFEGASFYNLRTRWTRSFSLLYLVFLFPRALARLPLRVWRR